jgi:C4-dicarboxylate-binding protein DctP
LEWRKCTSSLSATKRNTKKFGKSKELTNGNQWEETSMSKVLTRRAIIVAAGTAMASAMAISASATETIKLVAIDGYPAKAMWVDQFSKFFIPEVNKRLAETGNYEIEWQEAYGGAIVKPKGVLEGIKLGLGDIGVVTTVFHASELPSQALGYVTPFISTDARVVAKAIDEVAKEYPQMAAEFDAENQVYLATGVVLDTYQVFSREPIKSVKDIEGKKIGGAGYNLRYLEGIPNTAGVRGGLTDYYTMLQTGAIDGSMMWPEAAMTFKLHEVAPYMLKADLGSVASKTLTINKDVWNKLPEEVQNALKETAVAYRDHIAQVAMDRAAESIEAFEAAGGTVIELSPEERAAWANSMPNIAVEWAAQMDESGGRGSEMLKAYLAKLEAAGETPARDWSAELTN